MKGKRSIGNVPAKGGLGVWGHLIAADQTGILQIIVLLSPRDALGVGRVGITSTEAVQQRQEPGMGEALQGALGKRGQVIPKVGSLYRIPHADCGA